MQRNASLIFNWKDFVRGAQNAGSGDASKSLRNTHDLPAGRQGTDLAPHRPELRLPTGKARPDLHSPARTRAEAREASAELRSQALIKIANLVAPLKKHSRFRRLSSSELRLFLPSADADLTEEARMLGAAASLLPKDIKSPQEISMAPGNETAEIAWRIATQKGAAQVAPEFRAAAIHWIQSQEIKNRMAQLVTIDQNRRRLENGIQAAFAEYLSEHPEDEGSAFALNVPPEADPKNLAYLLSRNSFENEKIFVGSLDGKPSKPDQLRLELKKAGFKAVLDHRFHLAAQSAQDRKMGLIHVSGGVPAAKVPQGLILITHGESHGLRVEDLEVPEKLALLLVKKTEARALRLGVPVSELLKNHPELRAYFTFGKRSDGIISFSLARFSSEMRSAHQLESAA